MRFLLSLCLAALVVTACKSFAVNESGSEGYIIRYINMNAVYEHEVAGGNEAAALKNRRDDLQRKIKALESRHQGDDTELENCTAELRKLEESEKKFKAAVYSRIKAAVETVAGKHQVDFMLGTGEGVVYSRPVFDLTSEVIDELDITRKNSSPVWK